MTDLQSTLDAIDEVAVHRCGHCDAVLGPEAPSKYWCDDFCQEAFHASHCDPLVGYREPTDIPQHVYNLVEESDPETTPAAVPPWTHFYRHALNSFRFERAIEDAGFQLDAWQRQVLRQVYSRYARDIERAMAEVRATTDRALFGDLDNWRPTGIINSLQVATPVEPEPPQTEAVEFDFEHPSTAVLAAEEPPLPVMAPLELDIEALQRHIDGFDHFQTAHRSRRRIDPRGSR